MSNDDRGIHLDSLQEGRLLREFFQASDYVRPKLASWLASVGPPSHSRRNLPLLLHQTREPSRINTLVRWFIIGHPVEEEIARAHIPDEILALLTNSGLLAAENGRLLASVLLLPFGNVLTACDRAPTSQPRPDLVISPGPPTRVLSFFMICRKVRSALDLCCGPGVHAMKLTAQSENVTAADLNPRALQLARFNARINGMERIEFVQGDLFTPFQGRCFDLIVANPPFFLLPANEILYRDNPLELDTFVEKIVRQAPLFLNEGGFFQMIFEWVEIEGQPWKERLAEWVSGSGCDVWLIKDYSQRPTEYSHTKMQTVDQVSVEQDVATMAAWTEHYRRHNVVAMHGGIMAMRKRSGVNNWVEMEEYSIDAKSEFGELVETIFDGHDLVEKSDDEAMLALRPRLSPHLRLEQVLHATEEGWAPRSIELKLDQGLKITCGLDHQVATFLSGCTGKQSLGEWIEPNVPKDASNAAEMRAGCIGVVRWLIQRGFLLPG
jgi:SAM-dependent methyltransferase